MGMQTWVQLLDTPSPVADGAALASSVTLTDVTTAPSLVFPANFFYPGSAFRVTAAGEFSTSGTPTLLLGVYYGGVAGTALATSGAITTQSGASHLTWRLTLEAVVRSVGTSGTVFPTGSLLGVGTTPALLPANTPAAVTINTTVAAALTIGAQWGTSSASNTLTLHEYLVEALN